MSDTQRRSANRRPSRAELPFRALGREFAAPLLDLSATGCRFDCTHTHLCSGDQVVFRFSEHLEVRGKIAWRDGPMAGVHFTDPLPASLAVHIGCQPVNTLAEAEARD